MDKETLNKQATNLDEFCRKYIEYFKGLKQEPPEVRYCFIESPVFVQECISLGFKMDCGESFRKKYGDEAFNTEEALARVVDTITDIKVLGSGIFSQWRYLNHWAESSQAIYDAEGWFLMAFNKLLELNRNVQ